jgi:pyruvate ferredoxin oxidoreductase beta subunit/2-oxoisovalerate ferredoxin oxidoreductase beta subunit
MSLIGREGHHPGDLSNIIEHTPNKINPSRIFLAGSQEMINMEKRFPEEEHLSSGHLACSGCGAAIGMRYALKALGEETVVVIPASCWSIVPGVAPHTAFRVTAYHVAFETAASTATGIKAGLEMRGDTSATVMAWAGDGATFDIGFQALSGAAERNDDFIYE